MPQQSRDAYSQHVNGSVQAVFTASGLEVSGFPTSRPGACSSCGRRAHGTQWCPSPVVPSIAAAGVVTHAAGVSERYVNTPQGLEQWFTVERAPREECRRESARARVRLSGGLSFEMDGTGRILTGIDGPRGPVVTTHLWQVRTASGRVPYVEMQPTLDAAGTVDGFQIVTQVAEEDYPVTLALATGHPKLLDLGMKSARPAPASSSSSTAPGALLAPPANDTLRRRPGRPRVRPLSPT